jgi:hypothetical protein
MSTLRRWAISGVRVQLLTTALSLPVLIAWGLPVSIMSIVGNLLATPFLMGALLLYSLLFLTELIGFPNKMLYLSTEYLTLAWDSLLNLGKGSWLIGFSAPPLAVSIILCSATAVGLWWAVHSYKIRIEIASIGVMVLCLGFCAIFKNQFDHGLEHISCIKRNNQRLVIDDGFFSFKTSYKSPVRYQIKPLLYKTFGTKHIHRWHSTCSGIRSLRALNEVLNQIRIDEISFGTNPKKKSPTWRLAWQALNEKALASGTKIKGL